MKMKMFWCFIVTFIVVFLCDYLWHSVIFIGFYNPALSHVAYIGANGVIAPKVAFLLLGDVVFSILLVGFIPQMGGDNSQGTLAMRGALLGLLAIIHFPITSYAVVNGFPASIMLADGIYGLLIGTLASYIIGYFYRKSLVKNS